jgi:hypothetical protein
VARARGHGLIQGRGERADAYVHAWETGYHDLAVDYRSQRATDLSITVDGRQVATFRANRAGAWRSTVRVHLSHGINEVEVRSRNGVLVGELTTTRAAGADSAAVTVEAEDAVRHGATAVSTYTDASGSNASGLKGLGFVGNGAANMFEVPRRPGFDRPGDYDIAVTYANAELSGRHDYNPQVVDRRLVVTETGGGSAYAYFRYTYAWHSFLERTIPITLTTADAPLVFGNPDAYAPDIDKLVIAPTVVGKPTTVPR